MKDKYSKKDLRKFVEALNKLHFILQRCCGEDPISNYSIRDKLLNKIERKYNKAYKKVEKHVNFWSDVEMSKRALLYMCEANVNSWTDATKIIRKCKSLDAEEVSASLLKFFDIINKTLIEIPADFSTDSLSMMRVMRWNNRGNPVEDLASIATSLPGAST